MKTETSLRAERTNPVWRASRNDEGERGRLLDALVERGVTYLDGARGLPNELSDVELIVALTESDDARLRLALIPLFLAQSSLAELVPSLVAQLDPQRALDLKQRYTAAVCLQRFWQTRLREFVGEKLLPDLFSTELQLPPLTAQHGKWTFHALADGMSAVHNGIDFLASFNKTFEHFIRQREVEASHREPASTHQS